MKRRFFNKELSQKLFSFVLLTGILANAFAAGAQTRRPATKTSAADQSKPTAQKCSGAWTGSVTYTRTQRMESTEKEPLVSNRGTAVRRIEMNYDYTANVMVSESPDRNASSVGKGKIEYAFEALDKINTEERNSCDRGKTWRVMTGELTSTTNAKISPAATVDAQVRVAVNMNGSYTVNVALPPTEGKTSSKRTSVYSNQCVPKKGENETTPETPISVDGNSLTSDGSHFVDPKNPNRLSGSYTLKLSETASETITWNLEKCGAPLRVVDLKFYQLLYPSPNNWYRIADSGYTTDGNDVKVVATVANFSGENKRATVNFKELNENMDLPGGKIDADFPANEEKEVEFIWDTSGFSWKQSKPVNEADFSRRIEASIETDKKVASVQVRHKPIVVVPGLWSPKDKFFALVDRFKANKWTSVHAPVDINKKANENAPVIAQTVRDVQEQYNAWHVDMVAHSTGGLAARAYVDGFMPGQYDSRPVVTHLVMLGTPNLGTPCSTGVETIYTKIFVRNPDAFGEISSKSMKAFNQAVRSRHGTKFYSVAGDASPATCQAQVTGDSVVPFASAAHLSSDYILRNVSHENLIADAGIFSHIRYWLAVPPKGNHAPDNSQAFNSGDFLENDPAAAENVDGKIRRYGAMFPPAGSSFAGAEDEPEPNFATGVKLKANGSSEIEIPVSKGSVFSLVLYTSPEVSATLLNEKGETLGVNLAGSPEAAAIFRMITVKKPFPAGNWKLKLESRSAREVETFVTAFIDYNSTVFTAKKAE